MKTSFLPWNRTVRPLLLALSAVVVQKAVAQSGTWTNLTSTGTASGSWAVATNWNAGVIANGAGNTADFSTLNFANGSTVTLDGGFSAGKLIFADGSPTNWTVNASATNATLPAADAITLAGSGTPVINASNQLTTFNANLYGTAGFLKTGGGTLRINSANSNAVGQLSGIITVNQGDLQLGNTDPYGVIGNVVGGTSTNMMVCTNGGTVEVISTFAVNNELLLLGGTGNGGTNGALYSYNGASAGTTRWGLSINGANSSVALPAILLTSNATIRVDSTNTIGTYSNELLAGYISSSTNTVANITNSFYTLTKTGAGRLELERGMMVSNVDIQAGSVFPDSANGFNAVQQWTVEAGGALINDQNQTFNSGTITLIVNAGGLYDVNFRGTGATNSDNNTYTQNLGMLLGSGLITCGERGEGNGQTLNIIGTNNSVFSGPITDTNGDVLNFGKTAGATSTLNLSGANTYHGVTTVSAGTLLVDGSHLGGSNYVVSAGATLGGKGLIVPGAGNSISLSGNLVAGDNGGTLTVSNVTGAGVVIVSNANLTVLGQLNTAGNYFTTFYTTNGTTTALLQQDGTDASIYATAVNIDGANNILSFTTANPVIGQFPFIKYNGAIGGLNGFAGLTLQAPTGITAHLSNNVANSSIDIVITVIPAIVWNGTPTGVWSIGGSANWLNGSTAATYTETSGQGPFVFFDDTASGVTAVNVSTTVTPKGVTFNNNSKTYTLTGNGAINGGGSVVLNGTGAVVFANTNTFTGNITINAGSLTLGGGSTAGNAGAASIINNSQLNFNRSDNVTFANPISGTGALAQNGTGTVTLSGVGNVNSSIAVNSGGLALAPAGTITVSGNVTGSGAFGINGAGTVILSSGTVTYGGGTIISNGTLQLNAAFPPSGTISDYGTLAVGASGTLGNNITGLGGLTVLNGAALTLGGINTYAGATTLLGGSSLTATAASYPAGSPLVLGSTNGTADLGSATFTAGNPILGGLIAGGNSTSPGDPISFGTSGQTLTINGNVFVGNSAPSGASVYLPFNSGGSGDTVAVNTNGGVIQIGLGNTSSGVNPDNIFVDLSAIDNFAANLGTNGAMNLGTLDGNPGPSAGATVVNWFNLANVSNIITAGSLNIGAGGRQLVPELRLGAGTNVLNVNTLAVGEGGRDGGYLHFLGGSGGLRLRASDGVSPAAFEVGYNPATGTGASITNLVDLTGHQVDLLVSTLILGDYNNAGVYQNTLSFDTGVLNAQSTTLSVIRNNNANAAASGSTLNINGGTASLGPVTLTSSAAYGTLNINGATVTAAKIAGTGTGATTLSIGNTTLTLALTNNGNPVTAPVAAQSVTLNGPINLSVNGTAWTVGKFPLISYTGSLGGTGYAALNLVSLPSGVSGYLSNDVANLAVDIVVTNAPVLVNLNPTNITTVVSGNQLNLSWPGDHLGWRLQVQTNALSAGLNPSSNAWFTVSGSTTVTNEAITINPGNGAVFYRLTYP